jgi:hypothetical protein
MYDRSLLDFDPIIILKATSILRKLKKKRRRRRRRRRRRDRNVKQAVKQKAKPF